MNTDTAIKHILSCIFLPENVRQALLVIVADLTPEQREALIQKLSTLAETWKADLQNAGHELKHIEHSFKKEVREQDEARDRSSENFFPFDV